MDSFAMDRVQTEPERRWLSWSILSGAAFSNPNLRGFKHSYQGTANPTAVAKRRAKNKVAKASRKANR